MLNKPISALRELTFLLIVIFLKKTRFNQKTEQKTGLRSLWVPFVPDSSFQEVLCFMEGSKHGYWYRDGHSL